MQLLTTTRKNDFTAISWKIALSSANALENKFALAVEMYKEITITKTTTCPVYSHKFGSRKVKVYAIHITTSDVVGRFFSKRTPAKDTYSTPNEIIHNHTKSIFFK